MHEVITLKSSFVNLASDIQPKSAFSVLRDDLKRLLHNLNKQKDKLKKLGLTVDGKHYRVQFKGIVITLNSEKEFSFFLLFFLVPDFYFSTSLKKSYFGIFYQREILEFWQDCTILTQDSIARI